MEGRTISHYRVLSKIGQGGMGVVYKAEDTVLRRMVALKFLARKAISDDTLRSRFFREAQAAGGLNHPNICAVYGIEEAEDEIFIVMAYLAGQSLDRVITSGSLSLQDAIEYALEIGDGLREAHEGGIVHRDIKSANIIVTTRKKAVLTDFGLAMLSDRSRITRTGTTLGTLAYMSPEQALGKRVDQRTDIWSLGIVLYEMLTGQFPFHGETVHAICRSILKDQPRSALTICKNLPDDTAWIMSKVLAKRPEERYQHVDDFLVDLRALRRKLPEEARESHPLQLSGQPIVDHAARTMTLVDGDKITLDTDLGEGSTVAAQEAGLTTRGNESKSVGPPVDRTWKWVVSLFAVILLAGMAFVWWKSLN